MYSSAEEQGINERLADYLIIPNTHTLYGNMSFVLLGEKYLCLIQIFSPVDNIYDWYISLCSEKVYHLRNGQSVNMSR